MGVTDELPRYGIREARRVLPSVIEEAADGQRIIVTFRGEDHCAIVPLSDLQRLEKADAARKAKSQTR